LFIGGFLGGKTSLIFIRKVNRADLGTFTTAGAFGKVNVAGLFPNAGLETTWFAFKFYKFAFG
jgi:hypothetical protein